MDKRSIHKKEPATLGRGKKSNLPGACFLLSGNFNPLFMNRVYFIPAAAGRASFIGGKSFFSSMQLKSLFYLQFQKQNCRFKLNLYKVFNFKYNGKQQRNNQRFKRLGKHFK